MTEWLKIIYDIMAGLGFLIVFLMTIIFTWGVFLSFAKKRQEKREVAEEALMNRLAPEVRRQKLREMIVETEKTIEALNAKAADISPEAKSKIEELAGEKIKAGEENQGGG